MSGTKVTSKRKTFKWLNERLKININNLSELVQRKEVLLLLELQQEIFKTLLPKESNDGKKRNNR